MIDCISSTPDQLRAPAPMEDGDDDAERGADRQQDADGRLIEESFERLHRLVADSVSHR